MAMIEFKKVKHFFRFFPYILVVKFTTFYKKLHKWLFLNHFSQFKNLVKMFYFKMYRSKSHITQNLMLISMQKKRFSFQPWYLKVTVTITIKCIWLFFRPERRGNDQKFFENGQVTNKKVTVTVQVRKNYCIIFDKNILKKPSKVVCWCLFNKITKSDIFGFWSGLTLLLSYPPS